MFAFKIDTDHSRERGREEGGGGGGSGRERARERECVYACESFDRVERVNFSTALFERSFTDFKRG